MPWTADDASKYKKGLSKKQAALWARIANRVYEDCIQNGGNDEECAPMAIKTANSQVNGGSRMNKEERRYIQGDAQIETRDDGTKAITGYAGVFYDGTDESQFKLGELPDGREFVERIQPGAFDTAPEDTNVMGLFNHDKNQILGRNGASMTVTQDDKGLRFEIPVDDQDEDHKRALRKIERTDVRGASFGFVVNSNGEGRKTEDGKVVRELRSVTVKDVGPVTFPAYSGTTAEVSQRDAEPAWEDIGEESDAEDDNDDEGQSNTKPGPAKARARLLDMEGDV